MDWGPMLTRTVNLNYDQMLMIESHPRQRVKVIYGGVWLTEQGQSRDAWMTNGDEVYLKTRGAALLQGLGATRLQIIEAPRVHGVMAALRGMVAHVVARLRDLRVRLHLGPRPAATSTC